MRTKPSRGCDGAERVPVYILAGGRSRRYGSDKARVPVGGVPLIVRLARTYAPVARTLTVVAARDGGYADLGLRTIGDRVESRGPLGGLAAALDDHDGDGWIFLSACDWVGVEPGWVSVLLSKRNNAAEAVVFRTDRIEPLFALYRAAVRDTVLHNIERGRLAMHELLDAIATVVVPAPEGLRRAVNLNRPVPDPGSTPSSRPGR